MNRQRLEKVRFGPDRKLGERTGFQRNGVAERLLIDANGW
jgi:hypothetical protein